MDVYEWKIAGLKQKKAAVRRWPGRLRKAKEKRAAFCAAEGIDEALFSKWVNLKQEPSDSSVKSVEAALKRRHV